MIPFVALFTYTDLQATALHNANPNTYVKVFTQYHR